MSDPHKYNSIYSASDIQKYWKGELSAREMHQLEAAALEDPFLADALEGMAAHDTGQDLAELQQRLIVRVGAPAVTKVRPLLSPWMRAAAVVILALGLGGTAYYILSTSTRKDSLAQSTTPHEKALPPVAPTPADSSSIASPTTAAGAADSIVTGNVSVTTRHKPLPAARQTDQVPDRIAGSSSMTSRSSGADTAKIAAKDKAIAEQAERDRVADAGNRDDLKKTMKKAYIDSAASQQFIVRAAPVAQGYTSFERQDKLIGVQKDTVQYNTGPFKHADPLVFSGKVLDEHNNPLAGASISVGGKNYTSTQTDKNGLFSLRFVPTLKDSITNRKLMVSYKGYEEAAIDLSTLNSNQVIGNVIRLQPQSFALNEVVVTGYGARRKETLAEAPSVSDVSIDSLGLRAVPVDGLVVYRQYLETAKKSLSVDTTIKGTEIISFEVNRKGELSAFKIEQSLSPAHDAGVIRIIKEGPPWRLVRSKSIRAAVRVSF